MMPMISKGLAGHDAPTAAPAIALLRRLLRWSLPGLLLATLLLGGCSSPLGNRPAPVESRGTEAASPGVQVNPYQPAQATPQVASVMRPRPGRAVQALLDRASDQQQAGNYAAAAVSLERGLRIEPNNPLIWHRLARLDAQQGQFSRVEQLAAKSNSLAGNDQALVADNWNLIAQARAALGDRAGAQQARQRASASR